MDDLDRNTRLTSAAVHGNGIGLRDASLDNDGSGNRFGCQNVDLAGEHSHDRHQAAERQNSYAVRQALHCYVNTTLRLLGERTQTPRQPAAGWMGNSPGQTPVPAAGCVDLTLLSGKEEWSDRRRVRTGYDLLKELIIDDDPTRVGLSPRGRRQWLLGRLARKRLRPGRLEVRLGSTEERPNRAS